MVRTYVLDEVIVSIDGRRITEYGPGDAISVELDDDDWAATQGAHGAVVRARKHNALATCTLQLMQGSPSNEWLSDRANTDRLTGRGAFDLLIMDARAKRSLVSGRAWVRKRAALAFADEAGAVEWQIAIANPKLSHGTNEQA
jgi:hypothetical protein